MVKRPGVLRLAVGQFGADEILVACRPALCLLAEGRSLPQFARDARKALIVHPGHPAVITMGATRRAVDPVTVDGDVRPGLKDPAVSTRDPAADHGAAVPPVTEPDPRA
jgi:hypothetical protein